MTFLILPLFLLLLLVPARTLSAGRVLRSLPETIDPRQEALYHDLDACPICSWAASKGRKETAGAEEPGDPAERLSPTMRR